MTPNSLKITIKDRLKAYLYNFHGKTPVTALERKEFESLIAKGLINKERFDFLKFIFSLGKATALLGGVAVNKWGKVSVINFIESEEGKFTQIEEASLNYLKAEAEDRLESLFSEIGATINSKYRNRVLGDEAFRQAVFGATAKRITERKTIRQLASDIGTSTGKWGRDLYRIAFTESTNAYLLGTALGYLKKTGKKGDEIMVAKIPRGPGISCKDCIKHYWDSGKNQPKIFKMSDIIGESNVGRKRRDWVPTLTVLHPLCSCRLIIKYPGQIWNSKFRRFEYAVNKKEK